MDTGTPKTPADLCCNPHPIYVAICGRAGEADLSDRWLALVGGVCLPKGSKGKLLVVLFDGTCFSALTILKRPQVRVS